MHQIIQRQGVLLAEMTDLQRLLLSAQPTADKAPAQGPRVARDLVGTRWNEVAARGAVGVLARYAAARKQLTYTDLHDELVSAGGEKNIGMMQKYARALDRICLASAASETVVPPLTVLVINMRTRKPSSGFNGHLAAWLRKAGRTDLALAVEKAGLERLAPQDAIDFATEAVFTFNNWHGVIAELGLTGDPATDMARAL